jgi:hypothetical protein
MRGSHENSPTAAAAAEAGRRPARLPAGCWRSWQWAAARCAALLLATQLCIVQSRNCTQVRLTSGSACEMERPGQEENKGPEAAAARPEDSIPDLPENERARGFLANAPSKGLWMPLGQEVKVMQCWRCKANGHQNGGFGHRTGDRGALRPARCTL